MAAVFYMEEQTALDILAQFEVHLDPVLASMMNLPISKAYLEAILGRVRVTVMVKSWWCFMVCFSDQPDKRGWTDQNCTALHWQSSRKRRGASTSGVVMPLPQKGELSAVCLWLRLTDWLVLFCVWFSIGSSQVHNSAARGTCRVEPSLV